ncbi:Putative DNA ligase, ATP-dependent, nucleic acid-binding protein [Septoria linicola]|uniref:DNA ligase, ATP-dependent, nucleic acid-binding protein n=1 Tax=Septoria linicola TaxID=215465 RepID=A0A9Q9AQK9_9PEZI|nr:putative DNA ligase, ATP-dependent, nucleic acid-binding protein [Septoria linicola]USW51293.1 Putative DNA ligase, ATP-dependent, nucleic acid-binding protein [Septoria linicola]
MPLPFKDVCVLLDRLEQIELRESLLPSAKPDRYREVINSWFSSHRRQINELDVESSCALLSTLLPHWRTDRVYGIQAQGLCRTLSRALRLSIARKAALAAYNEPGNGDLATCFERVHAEGGPPAVPAVLVEHVDDMLQSLAGRSNFSDPSIPRLPPSSSETRDKLLSNVFYRASPAEGKWLIRLILKDFRPIVCEEVLFLKSFHFLLPDLLRFQRSFAAALKLLKGELRRYPEKPDPRSEALHRKSIADAQTLRPFVGTKISRPNFHKGRGIDACMNMMGSKPWVLERKYDGEYCEIHIDLRRSRNPVDCIKIFSKSGKDSTQDRKGVHQTLVKSLRIGTPECRFKQQAIVLGELVVFSDLEDCIMPFEEIRKHVARSGVFIGTEQDSMPQTHEHLAIVFFDLLLLDEEVVMNKPIDERRIWLRETYTKIHGRAIGADWTKIDFVNPARAKRSLVQHFALANVKRCEGLVLKPCEVPYFSIEAHPADYRHSYIKLKRDYIPDSGGDEAFARDEEDFVVIGATYNAQQAATASRKAFIKWTSFHLGCLANKDDMLKYDARPLFKHVGVIDQEHCIPRAVLETANILGNLTALPWPAEPNPPDFDVEIPASVKMSVVFTKLLVFEVLGSGYEKPSNCNYLMLRHPRVKKLHEDRGWIDCITFQELQDKGKASRAAPVESESQETRRWITKLEGRCHRREEAERLSTPARSTTSPRARTFLTPETSALLSSPLGKGPMKLPMTSSATTAPSPATCARSGMTRRPSLTCDPNVPTCKRRAAESEVMSPSCSKRVRRGSMDRCAQQTARATSSPMSDITNIVNADTEARRRSRASLGPKSKLVPAAKVYSQDSQTSQANRQRSRVRCERSFKCPFRQAVVYLAPCIAAMPYVVENLISLHDAVPAESLTHWDRDSFAYPALTAIVAESQSHEGMRKIVLVESRRRRATQAIIRQAKELNDGRLRERIDFYDWRVLENCDGHDRGADKLKTHFLGATLFDDTQERALFIGERDWFGA